MSKSKTSVELFGTNTKPIPMPKTKGSTVNEQQIEMEIENFINYWTSYDMEREDMLQTLSEYMQERRCWDGTAD